MVRALTDSLDPDLEPFHANNSSLLTATLVWVHKDIQQRHWTRRVTGVGENKVRKPTHPVIRSVTGQMRLL